MTYPPYAPARRILPHARSNVLELGLKRDLQDVVTKSVALHCARKGYGTRVNSVHPAFVDTPLVRSLIDGVPGMEEWLVKSSPLRRLGRPEEVAGMIVALASDAGRFMTGSEVVVDGGLTAR